MATAIIEHQDGAAIRHHCPRCSGAIAVESVAYGPWRTIETGGLLCRQRKVTITCDHCDRSVSTIERRFI
jgi:hypothetical protein